MSGSPAWIAAPPGQALSAPFPGTPEDAARAFLRANASLFGLTPREVDRLRHASTIPGANGWSHVHFAQTVAGLDVFGAVISVTLGPDNAAISAGGSLYGQLDLRVAPTVSAVEAVARAARDAYPDRVFTGVQVEASDGVDQRTVFDRAEFARPIEARLVVFPTQDGARLAWETRIGEPNLYTDYLVLVDAADGSFLYRQNLTLYAEARVINTPLPIPVVEEYAPDFYDRLPIPAAAGQSVGNWIAAPATTLAATTRPATCAGPPSRPSPSRPGSTTTRSTRRNPRSSTPGGWSTTRTTASTTSASTRRRGTTSRTTSGRAGSAGIR